MAREPIHLELRGLQTPRERVWAAVLLAGAQKRRFDRLGVQALCEPMVRWSCVEDYFRDLERAGFIKQVGSQPSPRNNAAETHIYQLLKPQGEAPRLTREGGRVVQGSGTEAMWRAMKVLPAFDYAGIAKAATLGDLVVLPSTAKAYVNTLARAGYLSTLRAAKPGTPARYSLRNNSGPHAPAVTRLKTVFDRNTGSFAHLQTAQEVCDGLA